MKAVYVHIPYCVQKCRYCDFCSVPTDPSSKDYAAAVCKEAELATRRLEDKSPAKTVFFGGGTPTVLPSGELVSILEAIRRHNGIEPDAEISIECNPATAKYHELSELRRAGFNRISIGLQSADDELLKLIGRAHSAEDFFQTFEWARQAGFDNINVDVMHGLPSQTKELYADTIQRVMALNPEHISAYALILEDGTQLKRMYDAMEIDLPGEDETFDMQDMGMELLEQGGYHRYEVSNFAKTGYECRHNLVYWNDEPYLGLGVAAHSSYPMDGIWLRSSNSESIPTYLKKLGRGKLATEENIKLYKSEECFEYLMLGLRKVEGISRAAFAERFGVAVEQVYPKAIAEVAACDWWQDDPERLALNRKGLDMLNTALVFFR